MKKIVFQYTLFSEGLLKDIEIQNLNYTFFFSTGGGDLSPTYQSPKGKKLSEFLLQWLGRKNALFPETTDPGHYFFF